MNIDNQDMRDYMKNEDWDKFYKNVLIIISFTITKFYPDIHKIEPDIQDLKSYCLERVWKRIHKIDKDKNIISYVIQMTRWRVLDRIAKINRRQKKATFVSIDKINIGYEDDYDLE